MSNQFVLSTVVNQKGAFKMAVIKFFQKSFVVFMMAVLVVASVAALVASIVFAHKISEDAKHIQQLNSQIIATTTELNTLKRDFAIAQAELNQTKINLAVAKTKLDSALIPQATVAEAFKENVTVPVVETYKTVWFNVSKGASNAWTNVSEGSLAAWNYVFK